MLKKFWKLLLKSVLLYQELTSHSVPIFMQTKNRDKLTDIQTHQTIKWKSRNATKYLKLNKCGGPIETLDVIKYMIPEQDFSELLGIY